VQLVLVNEALRCFDDGVLPGARDGDVGVVLGIGFPAFRGGPFRYVDVIRSSEMLRRARSIIASARASSRRPCSSRWRARQGVSRLSERLHATTMSRRMKAESSPYQQRLPQKQVGLSVPLLSNVIPNHLPPIVPDADHPIIERPVRRNSTSCKIALNVLSLRQTHEGNALG